MRNREKRDTRDTVDDHINAQAQGNVADGRLLGTVKTIVVERGFAFLKIPDGNEYFLHRSGYEGKFELLQPGSRVSFEPVATPKGLRAEHAQPAE